MPPTVGRVERSVRAEKTKIVLKICSVRSQCWAAVAPPTYPGAKSFGTSRQASSRTWSPGAAASGTGA